MKRAWEEAPAMRRAGKSGEERGYGTLFFTGHAQASAIAPQASDTAPHGA
jgi:hypothetical protein